MAFSDSVNQTLSLGDIPEDILYLIFPYLRPSDFLSLCRINKTFYETYRLTPAYWRELTTSTFRVPVHPLLKADGVRWHWLYKKLRTETKAFSWGQDAYGCLGHDKPQRFRHMNVSWPTEMVLPKDVGVVADLQCG